MLLFRQIGFVYTGNEWHVNAEFTHCKISEDGQKQVLDLYGRSREDIHDHLSKTFCRELYVNLSCLTY